MLTEAGYEPEIERSSRKEPLTEREASALLEGVRRVVVFRGRKAVEITSGEATARDLKGPTGNFRAPLLRVDDTLIVGFNRDRLSALFSR